MNTYCVPGNVLSIKDIFPRAAYIKVVFFVAAFPVVLLNDRQQWSTFKI